MEWIMSELETPTFFDMLDPEAMDVEVREGFLCM